MLHHLALVLTVVSCGVWIAISARRRSWVEVTLPICLMLIPVLQVIGFRGSEWVSLGASLAALASAMLTFRERLQDPAWRAAWTR